VPGAENHATVPPRADDDVVGAAEPVEEGARPAKVGYGGVHSFRMRRSLAPVLRFYVVVVVVMVVVMVVGVESGVDVVLCFV